MSARTRSTKPRKAEPSNVERIATFRAPTPAERRALDQATEQRAKRPARVAVKVEITPEKVASLWPAHSDGVAFGDHFTATFGTSSNAFADAAFARIEQVVRPRGEDFANQSQLNAALALMGAIEPANELEAAIGEQIVMSHSLAAELMSKAKHTDTVDKLQAYTNLATKVSRTMATHVETLARLRSGGKQTHEIRYVYVNGNAVLGDGARAVFAGSDGGVFLGNSGQPHAPDAIAGFAPPPSLPLSGQDAAGNALPIASGSGAEAMPDARRRQGIRRAAREGERAVHLRPMDEGVGRCAGASPGGDEGCEGL